MLFLTYTRGNLFRSRLQPVPRSRARSRVPLRSTESFSPRRVQKRQRQNRISRTRPLKGRRTARSPAVALVVSELAASAVVVDCGRHEDTLSQSPKRFCIPTNFNSLTQACGSGVVVCSSVTHYKLNPRRTKQAKQAKQAKQKHSQQPTEQPTANQQMQADRLAGLLEETEMESRARLEPSRVFVHLCPQFAKTGSAGEMLRKRHEKINQRTSSLCFGWGHKMTIPVIIR